MPLCPGCWSTPTRVSLHTRIPTTTKQAGGGKKPAAAKKPAAGKKKAGAAATSGKGKAKAGAAGAAQSRKRRKGACVVCHKQDVRHVHVLSWPPCSHACFTAHEICAVDDDDEDNEGYEDNEDNEDSYGGGDDSPYGSEDGGRKGKGKGKGKGKAAAAAKGKGKGKGGKGRASRDGGGGGGGTPSGKVDKVLEEVRQLMLRSRKEDAPVPTLAELGITTVREVGLGDERV